jgi:hypothetical protein
MSWREHEGNTVRGKTRLAVLLSGIWLLFSVVLGLASVQVNGTPGFVVTTLLVAAPVWLGWGLVWVRAGFKRDHSRP